MKKILLYLVIISMAISGCKKACTGCNPNQDCNNGICECKRGYEGVACDRTMSALFEGSFAGTIYQNGIHPISDTFIYTAGGQAWEVMLTNGRYHDPAKESSILIILSDTTATYAQSYSPNPTMIDYLKACGTAKISRDGHSPFLIVFLHRSRWSHRFQYSLYF